jgi:hypothetical protein
VPFNRWFQELVAEKIRDIMRRRRTFLRKIWGVKLRVSENPAPPLERKRRKLLTKLEGMQLKVFRRPYPRPIPPDQNRTETESSLTVPPVSSTDPKQD